MEKINWRNFDFWLLGAIVTLMIFGVTMIRSTVADNIELIEANVVQRQIIFGSIGLVVVLILAAIDYHMWSSVSRTLYLAIIFGLAALTIVGQAFFGSARWFETGFFNIQPSEIAKFVVILAMGNFFARNQDKINQPAWIVRSLIMLFAVIIWILLQPNLSTSILIGVIWFAQIWASGLKVKYLAIAAAAAILMAAIALPLLLNPDVVNEDSLIKPYQVGRITNFLFPEEEASYGDTYNVNQALISIGSGGLMGKGYEQGTQVQLRFLKVRHTDFIFASMAEEFGFVGVVLMMGMLFFVIWRIFRAARLARDTYGALLCYGVAAWIGFQAIVNMGMNLKLLPVTGLPLPFISYGGSALVSMLAGIGLVQSVVLRHKTLDF